MSGLEPTCMRPPSWPGDWRNLAQARRSSWEYRFVLLTVVDAFTDRPFSGNPAAVAVVDEFPPDDRMQAIAREMNLSETAFVVPRGDGRCSLRWFTPTIEVDLCGHATLASAHVVGGRVVFDTRSGPLTCETRDGWIEMNFPVWTPAVHSLPSPVAGLPSPRWTGIAGDDWLVELDTAGDVIGVRPDHTSIAALGRRALIVTARADPGSGVDIVSRVSAPNAGVPEDPVTGSAHCALAPYWAPRLGRDELVGCQASSRGGTVRMKLDGSRVILAGHATTVSEVRMLV
jgi:predicted PhzF superfamily epimerase YddE/YHI9